MINDVEIVPRVSELLDAKRTAGDWFNFTQKEIGMAWQTAAEPLRSKLRQVRIDVRFSGLSFTA